MKGPRIPFTDSQVNLILKSFCGRFASRNRALIALGVETGFRISELLATRRKDVIDSSGQFKTHLSLMQTKVDKVRSIELNEIAIHYLEIWLQDMELLGFQRDTNFIFMKDTGEVMSRVNAWKIIKNACVNCGIRGPTGTHSMRKTFARNIYQHTKKRELKGEDVNCFKMCKEALGHKNLSSTEHYLNFLNNNPADAIKSRTLSALQNA